MIKTKLIFLIRNSSRNSINRFTYNLFNYSYIERSSYSTVVDNQSTNTNKPKSARSLKVKNIDLSEFNTDKIRNFCIVAHIDHGKSTLSDRLLEETNLISKDEQIAQYTDRLEVERQRGITIKSSTVTLVHKYKNEKYLLNLIDTPGHADFSLEVQKTFPVCQGAILLVDATKGIQAQTVSHYNRALMSDLLMIPALNKIDVEFAKPEQVISQMKVIFAFDNEEIIKISAKTGKNVPLLLDKICELIPPPDEPVEDKNFEAFVFDSWHVLNEGVYCLVNIRNGILRLGDKIKFLQNSAKTYKIEKLGVFHPDELLVDALYTGQIGFACASIHELDAVNFGDLMIKESDSLSNESYKNHQLIEKPKQIVFASLFPYDQKDANNLKQAIKKIHLTDNSVEIEQDSCPALGAGYRLGFQGLLHMDVFSQRLDLEFNAPVVITAPQVAYKVKIKGAKNIKTYGTDTMFVRSATKLPDRSIIDKMYEPWIKATIMVPNEYIEVINQQTRERRGQIISNKFIDQNNVLFEIRYPLSEIIIDFYDELKTLTSGYASFEYEENGWEEINAVVISFNINKEPLEEMTMIVPKSKSKELANLYCDRIKKALKQQLYDVTIHGMINSKIIAKREIKAGGKNVLDRKLFGADLSRKAKLIGNQQKGRERMKERFVGRIPITRDVLINVLRKN